MCNFCVVIVYTNKYKLLQLFECNCVSCWLISEKVKQILLKQLEEIKSADNNSFKKHLKQ